MISYDVEWYHRLPPSVKEILEKLQKAGRQAYVVGGSVRDLWLGQEPKDFDLVSEAAPEEIEKLFPKTLDVGRSFGIMIVVTEEGPVEVARFRTDGAYTDNRHPDEVQFASPEEDAKRRDFTINALFYDPATEKVIDYVGGMEDLQARKIRAVGVASQRFQEDALRMLRAVRFHSQLKGFALDDSLLAAIREQADRLGKVSRERVTQEMQKVLLSHSPSVGLKDLMESDLWEPVFLMAPPKEKDFCFLDSLATLYQNTFGENPDLALPLGALCRRFPALDPARTFILERETKSLLPEIKKSLEALSRLESLSLAKKKILLARPSWKYAWVILNGEKAQLADLPAWFKELVRKGTLDPAPLVNGKDLMALGFSQGPVLKKILEAVREQQLDEKISTREQALALARSYLA